MIIQKIKIDLIPGKDTPIIHLNQNDIGTGRLSFQIQKNGSAYAPGGSVKIQGTKPGGETFEHTASLSGSSVTANVYTDMTDTAGDVRAQLVFADSAGRTGTQAFILRIQRETYDNTAV